MAKKSIQPVAYDTTAELLADSGEAGQEAFAKDTKTMYMHNGTTWIIGYALGKLIGGGSVPSAVAGSLAGTGATVAMAPGSNNVSGTIVITTGTSVGLSGTLVTVTLADGISFPNSTVTFISAADDNGIPAVANYKVVGTQTTFAVICGTVSIAAKASLSINYINLAR